MRCMGQANWKVPRTEEGFQEVLRRLAECRLAGDDGEVGRGLMALSFLVRWVRSDTDASPFVRSQELAEEALEHFRRAGDVGGLVRALVASAPMTDSETRESRFKEAEALAEKSGDENDVGIVLAARGRALGIVDRRKATEFHQRALEVFRRTGNVAGQAQCLFSLSIGDGTSEEKRDLAVEAAQLHRELGAHSDATRCITIALMNAEEIQPLDDLEPLARQGLDDALAAGDRGQEAHFYRKLGAIVAAQGRDEESEQFRRWSLELQEADGLTPLERWESEVKMAKEIIAMAKAQGNRNVEKACRADLKRLKASKPRADLN